MTYEKFQWRYVFPIHYKTETFIFTALKGCIRGLLQPGLWVAALRIGYFVNEGNYKLFTASHHTVLITSVLSLSVTAMEAWFCKGNKNEIRSKDILEKTHEVAIPNEMLSFIEAVAIMFLWATYNNQCFMCSFHFLDFHVWQMQNRDNFGMGIWGICL